jgi:hypothetical protein
MPVEKPPEVEDLSKSELIELVEIYWGKLSCITGCGLPRLFIASGRKWR